jgi:hypothetical protein
MLLTVLTGIGCESFTSEPPDPPMRQTEILEVRVEPNPVAVGDTATFTVIIEDSLDQSFEFRWSLSGVSGITVTDSNQVRWKAPDTPETYDHVVRVDNGASSRIPPSKGFLVTVIVNTAARIHP